MLRMLEREYQGVVLMPNHLPDKGFIGFALKMQQARLPPLIVNVFQHYYEQLVRGATGYIYNKEANPVASLPDIDALNGGVYGGWLCSYGPHDCAKIKRRLRHKHGDGRSKIAFASQK